MSEDSKQKKEYIFGGVKEFSLEEIEKEILNETVYLDVFAGSDSRFKTDVKAYKAGLKEILNVDSVSYFYKAEEFKEQNFPRTQQVGFIAQAVEKAFPHAVKKDKQGYLHVNYSALIPAMFNALKETSEQKLEQDKKIKNLEQRIELLENRIISVQNNTEQREKVKN